MWKARYWGVLGMQTLLALTLIFASLGLITATTFWAAGLLVIIIATSGRSSGSSSKRWPGSRCPSARALSAAVDRLTAHAGQGVRLHRHRVRSGRVCGRHPGRPAGPQDGRGGEGKHGRALPQRGLHSGQVDPARGRGDERGRARRLLRHLNRRCLLRLLGRDQAPRQGGQDAHRRRGDALREEQDRVDRGLRLGHRRRQREDRRAVRRHGDQDRPGDPGHRLRGQAPARPPVRQAHPRHRRHVAVERAARRACA